MNQMMLHENLKPKAKRWPDGFWGPARKNADEKVDQQLVEIFPKPEMFALCLKYFQ